ncbi:regulatory protein RecX [Sneathiella limimaris]|uniref:regulatory protein RecX n=1 Tax=Sneathiella limimaris TaxID=1964213 RepID=UPI00146C676E|nr:RecX family transcriptional regulator [Sneathiella limimaris]
MFDPDDEKPAKRKRKPPRAVTSALIREQALSYLDRFGTTTHKLKRHLLTKNRRAISYHDQDPEMVETLIEEEVNKLEQAGVLDDQLYADSKARSMARQGKSIRQINGKLFSLGLSDDQKNHAVQELEEKEGYSDRIGAAKYIRKKRFGPYRRHKNKEDQRNKELMSLMRNGFNYQLAEELIDLETTEEIEDIIYGEDK